MNVQDFGGGRTPNRLNSKTAGSSGNVSTLVGPIGPVGAQKIRIIRPHQKPTKAGKFQSKASPYQEDFLDRIKKIHWPKKKGGTGGFFVLVWANTHSTYQLVATTSTFDSPPASSVPRLFDAGSNPVPFTPAISVLSGSATIPYSRITTITDDPSAPPIITYAKEFPAQTAILVDTIVQSNVFWNGSNLPDTISGQGNNPNLTTPIHYSGDRTSFYSTEAAALADNSIGGVTNDVSLFAGGYSSPDTGPLQFGVPYDVHVVTQDALTWNIVTRTSKLAFFEAVFLINFPKAPIGFSLTTQGYFFNSDVFLYPGTGIVVDATNITVGFRGIDPPNGRVYVPLAFLNNQLPKTSTGATWPGYQVLFFPPPTNVGNAMMWWMNGPFNANNGNRISNFVVVTNNPVPPAGYTMIMHCNVPFGPPFFP